MHVKGSAGRAANSTVMAGLDPRVIARGQAPAMTTEANGGRFRFRQSSTNLRGYKMIEGECR
jgi:hypothetical protein